MPLSPFNGCFPGGPGVASLPVGSCAARAQVFMGHIWLLSTSQLCCKHKVNCGENQTVETETESIRSHYMLWSEVVA